MSERQKSCGNCIQCEKEVWDDGKEHWVCENYDRGVGMPYDAYPPNDDACSNWTDRGIAEWLKGPADKEGDE